MLAAVRDMPYSIGYASAPTVTAVASASVRSRSFEELRPTTKQAQASLSNATLTEQNVVALPQKDSIYPFIGVTYSVFIKDIDTSATTTAAVETPHEMSTPAPEGHDHNGRRQTTSTTTAACAPHQALLTFVRWAVGSDAAITIANSLEFVELPVAMRTLVDDHVRKSVKCNGEWLFEQDPEPAAAFPIWAVAVLIVIPIVILAVVLLLKVADNGKDNTNAPRESPCCIIFTDIESSTTLWGRAPDLMGAALDLHNEVLRRCIAKNKVYEVKTIGDSFMVAAQTPEQGLQFALDVQQALMDAPWDPEAVDEFGKMYADLHAEKGWALLQSDIDESLWRGLRVRVALHCGDVSVNRDPVSGGFDYHGSTVNMAARLESIGHGGQIIAAKESIIDACGGFLKSNGVIQHDLEDVQLRGMDYKVAITHVCASTLSRRQFATLRIDKQRDISESDHENNSDTNTIRTSGGASGGSMAQRGGAAMYDDYATVNALAFMNTLIGPLKGGNATRTLQLLTTAWRIPNNDSSSSAGAAGSKQLLARKVGTAAAFLTSRKEAGGRRLSGSLQDAGGYDPAGVKYIQPSGGSFRSGGGACGGGGGGSTSLSGGSITPEQAPLPNTAAVAFVGGTSGSEGQLSC